MGYARPPQGAAPGGPRPTESLSRVGPLVLVVALHAREARLLQGAEETLQVAGVAQLPWVRESGQPAHAEQEFDHFGGVQSLALHVRWPGAAEVEVEGLVDGSDEPRLPHGPGDLRAAGGALAG